MTIYNTPEQMYLARNWTGDTLRAKSDMLRDMVAKLIKLIDSAIDGDRGGDSDRVALSYQIAKEVGPGSEVLIDGRQWYRTDYGMVNYR